MPAPVPNRMAILVCVFTPMENRFGTDSTAEHKIQQKGVEQNPWENIQRVSTELRGSQTYHFLTATIILRFWEHPHVHLPLLVAALAKIIYELKALLLASRSLLHGFALIKAWEI